MIGSLFFRAVTRGERIHLAMLSRGFDGTPRSLGDFRMGPFDWLTLAGSVSLAVLFWFWVVS
jgi:cobalt/nickel transport system permease protein